MKINVFGVRGSIPTPGETTLKYGGNTPCVQVAYRQADGETETPRIIVFDAGTGIRVLGEKIEAQYPKGERLDIFIFLTHLHWDHIQGLPFFTPLYRGATRVRLFGPDYENLEKFLKNQMHPHFFPVSIDDDNVKAECQFLPLEEQNMTVGPVTVRHHYVNHGPKDTVAGFRADSPEGSFVYIPDCEPYGYSTAVGDAADPDLRDRERELIKFIQGSDIMLFDTMFTGEDYHHHKGWGHSPAEYALDLAVEAKVRKLGLFHYAPKRTDEEIDRLEERLAKIGREKGVEVFASREGVPLVIGEDE
jgi:phosphoribosyl 1,2-cyclic phosphodiesterase